MSIEIKKIKLKEKIPDLDEIILPLDNDTKKELNELKEKEISRIATNEVNLDWKEEYLALFYRDVATVGNEFPDNLDRFISDYESIKLQKKGIKHLKTLNDFKRKTDSQLSELSFKYDFLDIIVKYFSVRDISALNELDAQQIVDIFKENLDFINDFYLLQLIFPFTYFTLNKCLIEVFEKDFNNFIENCERNWTYNNKNYLAYLHMIKNRIDLIKSLSEIFQNDDKLVISNLYSCYKIFSQTLFLKSQNDSEFFDFAEEVLKNTKKYGEMMTDSKKINIYKIALEIFEKIKQKSKKYYNNLLWALFFPKNEEKLNNIDFSLEDITKFFSTTSFSSIINHISNNYQSEAIKKIMNTEVYKAAFKLLFLNSQEEIDKKLLNLDFLKTKNAYLIQSLVEINGKAEILEKIFKEILDKKDKIRYENDWYLKFLRELPVDKGFPILTALLFSYKEPNKIKMIQQIIDSYNCAS
ncbi:MAG: hypothetical protein ACTSRZ_17410 [Promethearchaeota archaeon]